jgi:hypothetical protein
VQPGVPAPEQGDALGDALHLMKATASCREPRTRSLTCSRLATSSSEQSLFAITSAWGADRLFLTKALYSNGSHCAPKHR